MRHMLKALGFWVWGLVAISIAVSVVPLGYRVATLWGMHEFSAPSDLSAPSGTAPTQSPTNTDLQPIAKISRLIAPEMTAAQQALQAGNWTEALRQLTAAEVKSPLTAFDRKYVYLGRSYVALKNDADAANAFAHLKAVPSISDRVLRLWTLYAESALPLSPNANAG